MLWYNFGQHLLSLAALLVIVSCGGAEPRRGPESSTGGSSSSNYSSRRFHRIQHGQCTYTFILPEEEGAGGAPCRESKASSPQRNGNSFQRDSPLPEQEFPSQKIQQLENIMENNTQWLQKIENYIKESLKMEMAQLQQSAVHNH
ncbi:angiopoietin-1-like, partial [Cynoglossus semilaevis]|uniref:angiopoietin-1-like n=1 Tax=Cynoglossus semilaevis TaxID=244447 RepID=UPI0007DCB37F